MRKIIVPLLIMVSTIFTMRVVASGENLVENGSFETPDIPFDSWMIFSTIPGWNIEWTNTTGNTNPPEIEVWDNIWGPAYDGNQNIELDAYDPTTISQIIPTLHGNCYNLTYAWSPRPNHSDNQLKVFLNGIQVAYHAGSGIGLSQKAWTLETYSFMADGPTTIKFSEVGIDDRYGMLLDGVGVTDCPPTGFVTGIGTIDSPYGAYAPYPELSGEASFAFVSRYEAGASTPTGKTQFIFQTANLKFYSDSYEKLVVAGAKAMFKGTGTINGSGNYGFMITAIDEKFTPSTDVDLFRIKIWNKDTDELIYDNQMAAEDGADPTTAVTSGKIVIHK